MQKQATQNKQNVQQKAPRKSIQLQKAVQEKQHPYLQAQGTIGNHGVLQRFGKSIVQPKLKIGEANYKNEHETENRTSIPLPLKTGLEALSGINLSSVRVHKNSSKPAQLNAFAYTQGQEIYIGPGQEKSLPHEGWHAVQQMHGRVKSTMQAKGVSINDDAGLEREAGVMGAKALQLKRAEQAATGSAHQGSTSLQREVETKGESEAPGDATGMSGQKVRLNSLSIGKSDEGLLAPFAGGSENVLEQVVQGKWKVKPTDRRESEAKFRAVAYTAPTHKTLEIGEDYTQKYRISNEHHAPKGTRYTWGHRLEGYALYEELLYGDGQQGSKNEVDLRPLMPGTKEIISEGYYQIKRGKLKRFKADAVTIEVPNPSVSDVTLESISNVGNRRPVIDTLQSGEELIVMLMLDGADASVNKIRANLDAAKNLKFKSVQALGERRFEIRLTPGSVGKASGTILLMPLSTQAGDATPVSIAVNIKEVQSQDCRGSRPNDSADAVRWVGETVNVLYDRRIDAVDSLYSQSKESDPPAKSPLWKRLLIGAAEIALNAVTAGLAQKIVAGIDDIIQSGEEVAKGLLEAGMSAAVEKAAKTVVGDPKKIGPREGGGTGPRVALGIKFRDLQRHALRLKKREVKQRGQTTVKNAVERQEKERKGSGFRWAMQVDANIKEETENVHNKQYVESFQSWATVMAQNQLNDLDGGKTTNLGKITNARRQRVNRRLYGFDTNFLPNVKHIPGVLRLELIDVKNVTISLGSREFHPLTIGGAWLSGVDSQAFADTIKDIPVRDLRMPIVAYYTKNRFKAGFVIGRNEANEYWTDEQGGALVQLAEVLARKALDATGAAKYIIEWAIGRQTVKPKKD